MDKSVIVQGGYGGQHRHQQGTDLVPTQSAAVANEKLAHCDGLDVIGDIVGGVVGLEDIADSQQGGQVARLCKLTRDIKELVYVAVELQFLTREDVDGSAVLSPVAEVFREILVHPDGNIFLGIPREIYNALAIGLNGLSYQVSAVKQVAKG